MNALPKFYTVANRLIAEIAKERGEDPKDFKEAILAKIRAGAGAGMSTPPNRKTTHGRLSLNE
jgi:hypothetical protein